MVRRDDEVDEIELAGTPRGIAVDASGHVYVAHGDRIDRFTAAGAFDVQIAAAGTAPGAVRQPYGLRIAELGRLEVDPSWYHEYYPLTADIAADQRRLADVRAAADAYLSFRAHRSEEAKKLAVLSPLARAEAEAALVASKRDRAGHVRRTLRAVERGRHILEAAPPLTRGSLQAETPWTYLALAEAELGRATDGPQAELWRTAVGMADTTYVRLYAKLRLAEALVGGGEHEQAESELRSSHAEAKRIGAARLQAGFEALATRAGSTVLGVG